MCSQWPMKQPMRMPNTVSTMFGRQTKATAYLYAAILTTIFSFLVNVLAHFRMKKIDMVESLKSAE